MGTSGLLDGTAAVVSGVGLGLGRAVCHALVGHGACVVAGDVDSGTPENLEAALVHYMMLLAAELRRSGIRVNGIYPGLI